LICSNINNDESEKMIAKIPKRIFSVKEKV